MRVWIVWEEDRRGNIELVDVFSDKDKALVEAKRRESWVSGLNGLLTYYIESVEVK